MTLLQCALFKKKGGVRREGQWHRIEEATLVLCDSPMKLYGESVDERYCLPHLRQLVALMFDAMHKKGEALPMTQSESWRLRPMSDAATRAVHTFMSQGCQPSSHYFLNYARLLFDWDAFSQAFALWQQCNVATSTLLSLLSLHACSAWPTERYAHLLRCSTKKFEALFRRHCACSASRWLHQQQLVHAQALLNTGQVPVSKIATCCGFSTHAYFSARFKKKFSLTPTQYKTNIRQASLNSAGILT